MKGVTMDWTKVAEIAVAVVGLIQWVKGLLPKAPTWVWAVASAVGCLGIAAAVIYLPPWVLLGLVALAVSQLGYETIVKLILSKVPGAPVA
jgi:hypothetical protein